MGLGLSRCQITFFNILVHPLMDPSTGAPVSSYHQQDSLANSISYWDSMEGFQDVAPVLLGFTRLLHLRRFHIHWIPPSVVILGELTLESWSCMESEMLQIRRTIVAYTIFPISDASKIQVGTKIVWKGRQSWVYWVFIGNWSQSSNLTITYTNIKKIVVSIVENTMVGLMVQLARMCGLPVRDSQSSDFTIHVFSMVAYMKVRCNSPFNIPLERRGEFWKYFLRREHLSSSGPFTRM